MKKTFLIAVLFLTQIFAFAQKVPFVYDKSKIDVGSMYSYKITSTDGKQTMYYYQYLKDENTGSGYIDFNGIVPQVQICEATYDPKHFCFSHTTTENPLAYAKKAKTNDTADIVYDLENKKLNVDVKLYLVAGIPINYSGSGDLQIIPSYELTGYQSDFWFSMRFFNGDYSDFQVGYIALPNGGTSNVHYLGEEVYNGKRCDKWQITQLDKKNKPTSENQILWFDKTSDNYPLLRYDCSRKEGTIKNYSLVLTSVQKMTPSEWNAFIEKQTENAKTKLKL